MENYIILSIISTILFGINVLIQKRGTGLDAITFALISIGISFFIIFIFWIFFNNNKNFSFHGLISGVLSGIFFSTAYIIFMISLRIGKGSIVAVINSLSAIIVVLASVFLFSEKLSITQLIGIILGIIAAILISL